MNIERGKIMKFAIQLLQKPEGIWQNEPDFYVEYSGDYVLMIRRHPRYGYLCGYVGVPASHKLFGKNTDAFVHGGITFANNWDEISEGFYPEGTWFFGFDCGHSADLKPFDVEPKTIYRDFNYVLHETRKLAKQLA
jgi:hypothetical protein